jgi:hypothetical protein
MNFNPMTIALIALTAQRGGTSGSKTLPIAIFAGMMTRQPMLGIALALAVSRQEAPEAPTVRVIKAPPPLPLPPPTPPEGTGAVAATPAAGSAPPAMTKSGRS